MKENQFFIFCVFKFKSLPQILTLTKIVVLKKHFPFSSFFVKGLEIIYSQRGHPLLIIDDYLFRKNRGSYWRCIRCTKHKCKSRLILKPNEPPVCIEEHTHGPETEKISWGRKILSNLKDETTKLTKVKQLGRQPHFNVDYISSRIKREMSSINDDDYREDDNDNPGDESNEDKLEVL